MCSPSLNSLDGVSKLRTSCSVEILFGWIALQFVLLLGAVHEFSYRIGSVPRPPWRGGLGTLTHSLAVRAWSTSAWPNRWKNCTFLDDMYVWLKFCWNFASSLMLFLSNRRAVWELENIPRHIWPTTDESVLMWVVLLCFGSFHWLINWSGPDQTVWSEKELKQHKKNATMSNFFAFGLDQNEVQMWKHP